MRTSEARKYRLYHRIGNKTVVGRRNFINGAGYAPLRHGRPRRAVRTLRFKVRGNHSARIPAQKNRKLKILRSSFAFYNYFVYWAVLALTGSTAGAIGGVVVSSVVCNCIAFLPLMVYNEIMFSFVYKNIDFAHKLDGLRELRFCKP